MLFVLPTCLLYSSSLPCTAQGFLECCEAFFCSRPLYCCSLFQNHSLPDTRNLFNRMLFKNDLNRALPCPASLKYHFLIPGYSVSSIALCVGACACMLRRALATDYNLGCLSLPYTLFEMESHCCYMDWVVWPESL